MQVICSVGENNNVLANLGNVQVVRTIGIERSETQDAVLFIEGLPKEITENARQFLDGLPQTASKAVKKLDAQGFGGGFCTYLGAITTENAIHFVSVGDSSVYFIGSNGVFKSTKDEAINNNLTRYIPLNDDMTEHNQLHSLTYAEIQELVGDNAICLITSDGITVGLEPDCGNKIEEKFIAAAVEKLKDRGITSANSKFLECLVRELRNNNLYEYSGHDDMGMVMFPANATSAGYFALVSDGAGGLDNGREAAQAALSASLEIITCGAEIENIPFRDLKDIHLSGNTKRISLRN